MSLPFRAAVLPITAFQQNCSIVWCEATGRGAVIDPGGEVERIVAAIGQTGAVIDQILLTHGHIDHAAGADELREKLTAARGVPVPVVGPHPDDRFLLQALVEAGQRWGQPGGRNVEPDRWLAEGDRVMVGEVAFDILHCPGHSPGSVVFVHHETDAGTGTRGKARFAFMGDVLFAGSIGRTDLPRGDHAQLIRSIMTKIMPLDDDMAFLPGHGPMSTVGAERRSNPYLT